MDNTGEDRRTALRGVFLHNGYAGTSIANLAAATELGKASLYHHFPGGKAAMARALIRDAVTDLQQNAFAGAQDDDDPKARIGVVIDEFERYVEHGRAPCLLALFALENAEVLDRPQLARQFESWLEDVAQAFEALGEPPKAARRRADRLFADLYGFICLAALRSDPKVFTRGIKQLRRELKRL
ncbi:MAG: TetR/AcrR family transcriptional regulator [Pseudomonadota bacterium]